jgi:cold shock protein
MNGTVIRIMEDKGFGFIRSEPDQQTGQQTEYFFHRTGLKNLSWDGLQTGTKVTFEVGQGQKGPRAEEIYSA